MCNKIKMTRLGLEYKDCNNKMNLGKIWFFVIPLIFIIVVLFCMHVETYWRSVYMNLCHFEATVGTSISSIASFWGGALGGIISGFLSIIGIMLTISYYRKSDVENKMIENKPFLNLNITENTDNIDKLCDLGKGDKKVPVLIQIENIGKNFARTLTYNNGTNFGGQAFNYIIKANMKLDKTYLINVSFDKSREQILYLSFFDCFMNEYIQGFIFRCNDDNEVVNIEAGFPKKIGTAFK
ncbi:hypothetical protein [Maledivibacter halophilus]|uniref:Uncharacterized protein n=1 Tax=Maledivibacter halophilus TaxID=36842 RepID=A0A1T5LVM4_9FIRM|nr:hypothetical protein [Maledivibacter halophilus]SKC80001.1 hypothetical protein SAMN02194393_03410 [Maledivibacter halophilus]